MSTTKTNLTFGPLFGVPEEESPRRPPPPDEDAEAPATDNFDDGRRPATPKEP